MVAGVEGNEESVSDNGDGVSFQDDESDLELDSGDDV